MGREGKERRKGGEREEYFLPNSLSHFVSWTQSGAAYVPSLTGSLGIVFHISLQSVLLPSKGRNLSQ